MREQYGKIGSVYIRLAEECAELIQSLMKIERFGPLNFHPTNPTDLNIYAVEREIEDVEIAIKAFRREIYNSFKISELNCAKAKLNVAKEALNETSRSINM